MHVTTDKINWIFWLQISVATVTVLRSLRIVHLLDRIGLSFRCYDCEAGMQGVALIIRKRLLDTLL